MPTTPSALSSPHGTVGAVALDASGRLAAATSTGGRKDQLDGRVGDAPLIGAGTYAGGELRGVGDGRRGGADPGGRRPTTSRVVRDGGRPVEAACDAVLIDSASWAAPPA